MILCKNVINLKLETASYILGASLKYPVANVLLVWPDLSIKSSQISTVSCPKSRHWSFIKVTFTLVRFTKVTFTLVRFTKVTFTLVRFTKVTFTLVRFTKVTFTQVRFPLARFILRKIAFSHHKLNNWVRKTDLCERSLKDVLSN